MAKSKRGEDTEDLNLVPIMNLVTILIPFLLMASSFVSLAVIDSTLPAIGPPTESQEEEDKEKLNLSIQITDEGYQILGAQAVLESSGDGPGFPVPCKRPGCPTADSYDTEELTRLLNQIKDRYEDEENVILVPGSTVPYEVLVYTMDAAREDLANTAGGKARLLFPYVVIAGGT